MMLLHLAQIHILFPWCCSLVVIQWAASAEVSCSDSWVRVRKQMDWLRQGWMHILYVADCECHLKKKLNKNVSLLYPVFNIQTFMAWSNISFLFSTHTLPLLSTIFPYNGRGNCFVSTSCPMFICILTIFRRSSCVLLCSHHCQLHVSTPWTEVVNHSERGWFIVSQQNHVRAWEIYCLHSHMFQLKVAEGLCGK